MDDTQSILDEFLIESSENLARLDLEFVELEQRPEDDELLSSIFRTIHTIKGTCGFFEFQTLEAIAHRAENLLSQLREHEKRLTPALTTLLLETVDVIKQILKQIEDTGSEGPETYEALRAQLQAACDSNSEAAPGDSADGSPSQEKPDDAKSAEAEAGSAEPGDAEPVNAEPDKAPDDAELKTAASPEPPEAAAGPGVPDEEHSAVSAAPAVEPAAGPPPSPPDAAAAVNQNAPPPAAADSAAESKGRAATPDHRRAGAKLLRQRGFSFLRVAQRGSRRSALRPRDYPIHRSQPLREFQAGSGLPGGGSRRRQCFARLATRASRCASKFKNSSRRKATSHCRFGR